MFQHLRFFLRDLDNHTTVWRGKSGVGGVTGWSCGGAQSLAADNNGSDNSGSNWQRDGVLPAV